MITNRQLREVSLSPQMKFYFERKLAPLPSHEIEARIEEMLKYLNMAIHCNGDIPVSKEIDDVWHYWILETADDYAAFVDADIKNRRIDRPLGVSILSSYVLNYGPFMPERVRYWPLAERLMERLGWDVDQLNDWLRSVPQPADRELVQ